jgi:hypothetical protein
LTSHDCACKAIANTRHAAINPLVHVVRHLIE